MKKSASILFIITIIIGVISLSFLFAREDSGKSRTQRLMNNAFGTPVSTLLNINNWAGWIEHNGESGNNPYTGGQGVWYPRSTAGVIYQDGFIWGGVVTQSHFTGNPGSYRVGGQTYRIGTQPGWIVNPGTPSAPPVAADPADPAVRIYRIRSDWQNLAVNDPEVILDAAELNNVDTSQVTPAMALAVINQYALDWNQWPGDVGAPYYDLNSNGQWDPGVDEPGIANADQVIWFACNDLYPTATLDLYGSQPIGLELQVTMWGYKGSDPLGQTAFRRYRIINKSGFSIDSMFVSQWSDPDLGVYSDDLAGCDTALGMGFVYNGSPVDSQFLQYGLAPAATGYDFLQGPIIYTGNPTDTAIFDFKKLPNYRNLPMTSFAYFAPGSPITGPPLGVYEGTIAWYNMLNGYQPVTDSLSQIPYVYGSGPNAGQPTQFPLSGDPVNDPGGINGDVDGQGNNLPLGDRRIVLSSGPFTMANGDTQELVVGIVSGISIDYLASVAEMKINDFAAQSSYDALIQSPTGIRERDELYFGFELMQNYPNPFNPTTTIEFALPHSGFATLTIYNILGEEVAMLVSQKLAAGKYKYEWDAGDLPSGVYMYRIEAESFQKTKKLILMK